MGEIQNTQGMTEMYISRADHEKAMAEQKEQYDELMRIQNQKLTAEGIFERFVAPYIRAKYKEKKLKDFALANVSCEFSADLTAYVKQEMMKIVPVMQCAEDGMLSNHRKSKKVNARNTNSWR